MSVPPTNAEAIAAVPSTGVDQPVRSLTQQFLLDVIATLVLKADATALAAKLNSASPTVTSGPLTLAQDAASALQAVSLQQLQAIAASLGKRGRVRVCSTANVNLAAPGATINGVTMVSGDTVLLKDQTTGSQNGVYVWNGASSLATRSTEFDTWVEFPGALISVYEGTVNPDTLWFCSNNDGGTLGTTTIVFGQVSAAAGALLASNNLSDVANAATALANLGGVRATAPVTSGAGVTTPNTVTITSNAGTLDLSKALNIVTNGANTALALGSMPATNAWVPLWVVNTDGSNPRVFTFGASVRSLQRQANYTAFTLPANGRALIWFYWDGTTLNSLGDPVPLANKGIAFGPFDAVNGDYTVVQSMPHDGTFALSTTQCKSGSATFTIKSGTTPAAATAVTGTANAVSTTEQGQVISKAFVAGDAVVITVSAASACVGASLSLDYAPASA